jgi:hypothetical protein
MLSLIAGCSNLNRETASSKTYFARSDRGVAVTESERQQATSEFITLLKDTQYFDFIDSRVHGMPESNPDHPFWWGTMWTGVKVQKLKGSVTYIHSTDGSDNAGIQTSPFLENACFAYILTGDQKYAHLARRLMRGMSAWILSSARSANETPKILSRVFYPQSFHSSDRGLNLTINYEASRPGINGIPSSYVHLPNNPSFGDIWIKNNRSVDDIGHMIRAIAQVQSCRDFFDEEARADLDQLNQLYSNWASSVDSNNFIIPTYNLLAEPVLIKNGLGDYNTYKLLGFDPTCIEKLAVRLLHGPDTQNLNCNKGISLLEKLGGKFLQNDAIEILRSHHVAAVAMAQLRLRPLVAEKLMEGLVERMDRDLAVAKNIKLSPKFDIQDIPTFLIHANNVGVPLTSEEIHFVYERLHTAYIGMRDPAYYNTFHLFDPSVPDGSYSFDPPHIGLYFYALGSMLGSCTSSFQNPNARALLDCERIKKALSKD